MPKLRKRVIRASILILIVCMFGLTCTAIYQVTLNRNSSVVAANPSEVPFIGDSFKSLGDCGPVNVWIKEQYRNTYIAFQGKLDPTQFKAWRESHNFASMGEYESLATEHENFSTWLQGMDVVVHSSLLSNGTMYEGTVDKMNFVILLVNETTGDFLIQARKGQLDIDSSSD